MIYELSKQIEGHTICALGDGAAWPVQVSKQIEGHTICALGDGAAWPVQVSIVNNFLTKDLSNLHI